jgi:hypothetical protein
MSEISETYIKMAREAKEIQEGWEPKPGDKVYNNTFGFSHLPNEFVEDVIRDMYLWLPRQEDLQELYLNGLEEPISEIMAFINFKDWVLLTRIIGNGGWENGNLTELWLSFVMETCYHKHWDGKTWVVI